MRLIHVGKTADRGAHRLGRLRATGALSVVGLGVALCVGCSRQGAQDAQAAGPVEPSAVTNQAVQRPPSATRRAANPPASKDKTGGERSRPGAPAKGKAPAQMWKTPEGPLDDAKFTVISAKFLVAVAKLHQKGKLTADSQIVALAAILKDANVTLEEYKEYADKVAQDPRRREQLGAAIVAMAEKHGGVKVRETDASLGKLQVKGKILRQSGAPGAKSK